MSKVTRKSTKKLTLGRAFLGGLLCLIVLFGGFFLLNLTHSVEYFPVDVTWDPEVSQPAFEKSFYGSLADSIVKMYTTKDKLVQRDYIDRLYITNATFDDNLVIVHDSEGIKY